MRLEGITVRPITKQEVSHYNDLMQAHHYLGASQPIGETLRYVALYQKQWVALISFSAAALKCAARDQWIGWSYRHQFDRLNLVTNNSRFLILPQWHYPNLASRTLSLCQRRMKPGALILASSPNVSHYRIILMLLRGGEWSLTDDGIMDRTHLRWFTPSSFAEMFESTGYNVLKLEPLSPFRIQIRLQIALMLGKGKHLFFKQIKIKEYIKTVILQSAVIIQEKIILC